MVVCPGVLGSDLRTLLCVFRPHDPVFRLETNSSYCAYSTVLREQGIIKIKEFRELRFLKVRNVPIFKSL
jgi:hypothetical protein